MKHGYSDYTSWLPAIAGSFAALIAYAQSGPLSVRSSETRDRTSAMAMGVPLPTTLESWSRSARLFAGLGNYHRPVRTKFRGGAALF